MLKTRVIPSLLLKGKGLVKTTRFKNPNYLGDPINIVKIFNDKEVDEICLLDITASRENREPDYKLIERICAQAFMPMAYGGGVRTTEQMQRILGLGIEKIVINSAAINNPDLIREASERFGSQSIVASLDVKKTWLGGLRIFSQSGTTKTKHSPVELAKTMQDAGAGEILLNAIDRDGMMTGFDTELIRQVSQAVTIPVIACGGAGSLDDFGKAVKDGGADAVSAGSLFVYQGKHKAILINFPTQNELHQVLA